MYVSFNRAQRILAHVFRFVDSLFYIGGGYSDKVNAFNVVEKRLWTTAVPSARFKFAVASSNNEILVCGGVGRGDDSISLCWRDSCWRETGRIGSAALSLHSLDAFSLEMGNQFSMSSIQHSGFIFISF